MTLEALPSNKELLEEGEEPKKRASALHGKVCIKLGRYLDEFADAHKLGHVLDSSTVFNFQDGQPKRLPDVSFVSFGKMPEAPDEESTVAPDLAVEVVSKNDTISQIEEKILQYQQAGVRLLWLVYPNSRKVEVYRPATGLIEQVIGPEGELDGKDVLPGFKLPVRAIFRRGQD